MSDTELHQDLWTVDKLAAHLGIGERQVQKLASSGVLIKDAHGKYPSIDNIRCFIKYKTESDTEESRSEDKLRIDKLFEEARKLKFDNDLKQSVVAPVSDSIAVIRPLITMLSQKIDLLPEIAAAACDQVDGRGREKMAKALITEKNELARIPERLLAASKTVVN